MIKLIIMGLWVLLVTLGALFVGSTMTGEKTSESLNIEIGHEEKRTKGDTEIISVPVMVEGEVSGYIITQLTYVMDENAKIDMDIPIVPFINDAIFAEFFGAYTDKKQIERVRFEASRQRIIETINQRFAAPIIKDLLVQQFNFVSADKLRIQ